MPVPRLPNETITLIFELLWRQLSVQEGNDELEAPYGRVVGFVYGPLTLVNKTWRHLALPFLTRRLDTLHAPVIVTSLVQQGLAHSVRNINFNPLSPDDASFEETERQYREMLEALADASPASLQTLGIGLGSPYTWNRGWREEVEWRQLPLKAFTRLIDPPSLSRFTGVRSLAINIPLALPHLIDLANSFPHLQELSVQMSEDLPPPSPDNSSSPPRLSARLDKLSLSLSYPLYFRLFSALITPVSDSLSTLCLGSGLDEGLQLFSGTSFPQLRTLLISDHCDPDLAQASAFSSFPTLERASVPLHNFLDAAEFPALPPSLTHLTIRLDPVISLEPLVDAIAALARTNLHRLEVDYLPTDPDREVEPSDDDELNPEKVFRLQSECQRLGIELLGPIVGALSLDDTYDPKRPRDDFETDREPLDYDAEDLPAFFPMWSLEKQLEVGTGSGVGLSCDVAAMMKRWIEAEALR
ncbi:hypothetical protein JCM1840_002552 [Sporobolomyces johnsonii]